MQIVPESRPQLASIVGPRSDGSDTIVSVPRAAQLSLLGSFRLAITGAVVRLPRSAQRVLAYLGVRSGRASRARVAGMLWPDASEARAQASLRSAIWRIRREAGPLVHTSPTEVSLTQEVEVDLWTISELARSFRIGDADPRDLITAFSRDLLPDWYEDWVVIEQERVRQTRLHALESLCGMLVADHRFAEAVEAGLAAVAGEPLRESAHRALIRAHLAEGNPVEAMRQYRIYRSLLSEELGIEPSAELTQLMGGLAHDVARAGGARPAGEMSRVGLSSVSRTRGAVWSLARE